MNNINELFSVKDKVIIITGGAGFLGRQYAEALTEGGAIVVVWDKGGDHPVDITNEAEIKKEVQDILNQHSRIDVLINNAAMNPAVGSVEAQGQFVPYEEYSIDLWRQELEVNLTGMMICTKTVAPIMIKQQSGSIVNVASDLAIDAHDHRVYNDPDNRRFKSIGYTTTKSAILGFTRQWAARLGQHKIRVNTLSPIGVEREGMPQDFVKRYGGANMFERMAQAGEYVGAVIFLCSEASAFMTAQNLVIDGGKTSW